MEEAGPQAGEQTSLAEKGRGEGKKKKYPEKISPRQARPLQQVSTQLRAPGPRRSARDEQRLSRYPPPPGCRMQERMRSADAAHHGGGQSVRLGRAAERELAGSSGKEGSE